jgi:hypothetical protein
VRSTITANLREVSRVRHHPQPSEINNGSSHPEGVAGAVSVRPSRARGPAWPSVAGTAPRGAARGAVSSNGGARPPRGRANRAAAG